MRFIMINKILFAIIIGAFLTFPQEGHTGDHERGTWYVGFGFGTAIDARYSTDQYAVTFDEVFDDGWVDKSPKFAVNVKFGAAVGTKTLFGFDFTTVRQEGTMNMGSGRLDGSLQVNNYFLMLTHFPAQGGFFLRAGGGYSTFVKEASLNGVSARETVNGFGALGGMGYAFRLGESFHLTLNLDHSGQFYSGGPGEPDRSQFTALYVGFDWF